MSRREREKLDVVHRMVRGELSRMEGARLLHRSRRQIYRMCERYRAVGDGSVLHRSRGGHSARGYPLEIRNKVLLLYKTNYGDYGPSLFGEQLEEKHGLHIHRETLRRWLLDAGLWRREVTGRKRSKHRKARPRRAAMGEMLQIDGSPHNWLEGRNPSLMESSLLVLIDDASGRIHLWFRPTEDTQGIFELLRSYFLRYGLPQSIYSDRGTVYWTDDGQTQYARAMQRLGILVIYAGSAPAKGRVERSNRVHQDRLIKALRREDISSLEEANVYVEQVYHDAHNNRRASKDPLPDVHRVTTAAEVDRALCFETLRTVKADHTVTISGIRWQIEKPEKYDRYLQLRPGAKVTVCVYLNGSVHIFAGEQELRVTRVIEREEPGARQYTKTGRKNRGGQAKDLISKHIKRAEFSLSNPASAGLLKETSIEIASGNMERDTIQTSQEQPKKQPIRDRISNAYKKLMTFQMRV